jgi:hypothetical protein
LDCGTKRNGDERQEQGKIAARQKTPLQQTAAQQKRQVSVGCPLCLLFQPQFPQKTFVLRGIEKHPKSP